MSDAYKSWIEANVDKPLGACHETSTAMVKAFPELRQARGHYYCAFWGEREHWWCVDADGTVVDPTAAQFPSEGNGHYEELDPNAPEPIGKCLECGAYTYRTSPSSHACSDECEASTDDYLDDLTNLYGGDCS